MSRSLALLLFALLALGGGAPAALADDPPAITLTAPTPNAAIGAGVPTTITAVVPGAIAVVSMHLDGGPPLCVFTHLHDAYACPWTPGPQDVGAHTVQAWVTDAAGQTTTASVPVTVDRLLPTSVAAVTTGRRARGGALRLTTSGSLALPAGLTASACGGTVTVTVLAGSRTLVDRSVPVAAGCSFASHVTVAPPRGRRSVRVKVVYAGGTLLAPRSAPVQTVRLRRR